MPEPCLRDVQRWMKSRILPPERGAAGLPAVALNPQAGEPGEERLSVYSGGYVARMQEALEEPYAQEGPTYPDAKPVRIPEGCFFVMGDNRMNSEDSRQFGPVPLEKIEGKIRPGRMFSLY